MWYYYIWWYDSRPSVYKSFDTITCIKVSWLTNRESKNIVDIAETRGKLSMFMLASKLWLKTIRLKHPVQNSIQIHIMGYFI
jgi:hypothetical protein